MATLVLGGIGTLLGGPVGGALGALAGRSLDNTIIGSGNREGARLQDLAISTSSYGMPIGRYFGAMRVAGSVIWATELTESREKSGGSKGRPSVTSYSYATSFALALSSRPIARIGRIWADGSLLRGAAGDLKVGGTLRVHTGHGDQTVDPLIIADKPDTPAYRGTAYLVFEDLQLADFGNRIPTLSVEVFADEGALTAGDLLRETTGGPVLAGLAGIGHDGGGTGDLLTQVDALFPLDVEATQDGIVLSDGTAIPADPPMLGPAIVAGEDEFGGANGMAHERGTAEAKAPAALRYYDPARDYQPGLQYATRRAATGQAVLEFPATLAAPDAQRLLGDAVSRQRARRETLQWRVAELDPAVRPGKVVRAPGVGGLWRVASWEWRDTGLELTLDRIADQAATAFVATDAGILPAPPDRIAGPTLLRAFEAPWDGTGAAINLPVYAALATPDDGWRGAALYADTASGLAPLGPSGSAQAVFGTLNSTLAPSAAVLFESAATLDLTLATPAMHLASASLAELADGANRLLVGGETIQFATATRNGSGQWTLRGLLRGRGGTEGAARPGHPAGTMAALLDDSLVPLQPARGVGEPDAIAAIGPGDAEPVIAPIANPGLGQRPLSPVHGRLDRLADGSTTVCWTRRARGAWIWHDGIAPPLHEDAERYRISIGPTTAPLAIREVDQPTLTLSAADTAAFAGEPVRVRQIGRASLSPPLMLGIL